MVEGEDLKLRVALARTKLKLQAQRNVSTSANDVYFGSSTRFGTSIATISTSSSSSSESESDEGLEARLEQEKEVIDKRRLRRRRRQRRQRRPRLRKEQDEDDARVEEERVKRVIVAANEQQSQMLSFLQMVDSQLQERVADKRREDFARRLEHNLVEKNRQIMETLLSSLHFNPHTRPDNAGYFRYVDSEDPRLHSSPHHTSSTQLAQRGLAKHSIAYQSNQGGEGVKSPLKEIEQQRKSLVEASKNMNDSQRRVDSSSLMSMKKEALPRIASAEESDESTQKEKSIWDRLKDDDPDLLELSEDEGEKATEKDAENDEEKDSEGKRHRPTKAIVFGKGQPMYRWRKQGNLNPPPEQVLRGKALFRAIAYFMLGLKTMEHEALAKRKALGNEDLKDVQRGIVWIGDKIKTWISQVLAAPLQDLMLRKDLMLDPRSTSTPGAGVQRLFLRRAKKSSSKIEDAIGGQERLKLQLKVRIRGILELLLKSIQEDKPPLQVSILSFLNRIVSDGCVYPDGFLFPHEEECLDFSAVKYTRWMVLPIQDNPLDSARSTGSQQYPVKKLLMKPNSQTAASKKESPWKLLRKRQKDILALRLLPGSEYKGVEDTQPKYDLTRVKLILANFVLVRCLLPIILKPWEAGLGPKPEKRQLGNFTVIASLLYEVVHKNFGGPSSGETDPDEKKKVGRTINLGGLINTAVKKDDNGPSAPSAAVSAEASTQRGGGGGLLSRFKRKPSSSNVVAEDAKEVQQDESEDHSVRKDGGEPASQDQGSFPSIYSFTSTLLPPKAFDSLPDGLAFLSEVEVLFQLCLVALIEKVLETATDDLPQGLLQQIGYEKSCLEETRMAHENRRMVRKRNEDLQKRKVLAAMQKQLEEQQQERQIDQASASKKEYDQQKEETKPDKTESAKQKAKHYTSDDEDGGEESEESEEEGQVDQDEESNEEDNDNDEPEEENGTGKSKDGNSKKVDERKDLQDNDAGEQQEENRNEEQEKLLSTKEQSIKLNRRRSSATGSTHSRRNSLAAKG